MSGIDNKSNPRELLLPKDVEIESDEFASGTLVAKITKAVEYLRALVDNAGDIGAADDDAKRGLGHNHGYGFPGTPANSHLVGIGDQQEMDSRHVQKMLFAMPAFNIPVATNTDVHVFGGVKRLTASTFGEHTAPRTFIVDNENSSDGAAGVIQRSVNALNETPDLVFMAGPGTRTARLRVWVRQTTAAAAIDLYAEVIIVPIMNQGSPRRIYQGAKVVGINDSQYHELTCDFKCDPGKLNGIFIMVANDANTVNRPPLFIGAIYAEELYNDGVDGDLANDPDF